MLLALINGELNREFMIQEEINSMEIYSETLENIGEAPTGKKSWGAPEARGSELTA